MNIIKDKKVITKIFESTNSTKKYNDSFKVIQIEGNDGVLISVSKKLFKRAVDRNRIKRLIKEAIRNKTINKTTAISTIHHPLYMSFLWGCFLRQGDEKAQRKGEGSAGRVVRWRLAVGCRRKGRRYTWGGQWC